MLGLGLGVDKIRPVTAGGLLDLYPATAAYSLRALSSSTTNVVRVREDGTNTEQDFTADEITDGTLATFCGANNGFVVTWYDQSGSNNATQATAGSQPKIYDSSTGVVLENGKAALDFDGVDDTLISLSSINANAIFLVNANSSSGIDISSGTPPYISTGTAAIYRSNIFSPMTPPVSVGTYSLKTFIASGSSDPRDVSFYQNSLGSVDNPKSLNLAIFTQIAIAFYASSGAYKSEKYQELIIYATDQSANRTAIESNINDYYSIYP